MGTYIVLVGSVAGFDFNEKISSKVQDKQKNKIVTELKNINCKIEGLARFTEAHHSRVAILQGQLMKLETKSSDQNLIPSYQNEYKESAARLREDINIENGILLQSLTQLEKKCE